VAGVDFRFSTSCLNFQEKNVSSSGRIMNGQVSIVITRQVSGVVRNHAALCGIDDLVFFASSTTIFIC